jgi:AcrR family transcriptional regulator
MKIRVAKKPADSYQHGDLREALVDAGLRLLTEGGVENLSLRAAAQLAGVSHAAPYRHYRDKDALVAAVAERGFQLLNESMRTELARRPARTANERLTALGLGYIGFATRYPAYLQLIFGGVLTKAKSPPPSLQVAGEAAYLTLRDVVAAGIAQGELRAADPDEMALACWSIVHGFSMLTITGAVQRAENEQAEQALASRLLDLLAHGTAPTR